MSHSKLSLNVAFYRRCDRVAIATGLCCRMSRVQTGVGHPETGSSLPSLLKKKVARKRGGG